MAKKNRMVRRPAKGSAFTKKSRKERSKNKSVQPNKLSTSIIQSHPEQSRKETKIRPQTAEIISVVPRDLVPIADVRRRDSEKLGKYIEEQFREVCATLRELLPLIAAMKSRFLHLSRKKQGDGTYKTIRGCRSFKEWVETKLRRSERTVYYLLAGGNPQNAKVKLERKAAHRNNQDEGHNAFQVIGGAGLSRASGKEDEPLGFHMEVIEEREVSQRDGARLAKAIEEIKNAKSTIEALRDKIQKVVPKKSKHLRDASKQQLVLPFDRIINYLDHAAREAGKLSIAFDQIEGDPFKSGAV